MAETYCGIDFGTSNTVFSYNNGPSIKLVTLEKDKTTIPSAMFFNSHDNNVSYGQNAINQFFDNEEGRFMRSLKRVLGTALMQQGTVINGQKIAFQDIIGGFLKHIKTSADKQAGGDINHVVMGRPVFFVDGDENANQRAENELEKIAKAIGFKHIAFQFEPIAAAFSHETMITQEHICLVVDIGGGTSDFTIIKLSPENHLKKDRQNDILSNTGLRIGGNDFDKNLSLGYFMPYFGYQTFYGEKNLTTPSFPYNNLSEWSKVNSVYNQKTIQMMRGIYRQSQEQKKLNRFITALENEFGHTILAEVEKTKICLTQSDQYTASLEFIEKDFQIKANSNDLKNSIKNSIKKIKDCAQNCIKDANVKTDDVSMIILTGGSTELPFLQNSIKNLFPKAKVYDNNKFSSVAYGLNHDALRRFK